MKTHLFPAIILGFIYLCFLGYVVFSAADLPDRVATHFDFNGQPDGWMSRFYYLVFILVFGFAFPLLIVGIIFLTRFIPDSFYHIPNRDYWFAPERRAETHAYLLCHSLWFASIALCFVIGIHYLTIQANHRVPVQLSSPMIYGLAGCFVGGAALWAMSMSRHFKRTL